MLGCWGLGFRAWKALQPRYAGSSLGFEVGGKACGLRSLGSEFGGLVGLLAVRDRLRGLASTALIMSTPNPKP